VIRDKVRFRGWRASRCFIFGILGFGSWVLLSCKEGQKAAASESQLLAPPEPLAIFLHPGDRLTLDSTNGPEVTVDEFRTWKQSEVPGPHIILDTPPGATIDAWNQPLSALAEMGFGKYQLRLGGQTFNCHLPGSCCPGRGKRAQPAEIIDLRKREDAPDPTEQDKYDVQVFADRSTTWDEILQHTRLHLHSGISMMIDMDGGIFLRDRDEDEG
jgi:hypothetical protein